jgi:hypothetical protein
MGRWFGYRPGYIDSCKLFTTADAIEKNNQTTKCIEELEYEFQKMSRKGSSPEKFVLRVKKHPGTLKITRPSIMKNTEEVNWSYQDQLEMTTTFDITKLKIERVWNSFKHEIAPKLKRTSETPKGFLTYKASGAEVIDLLQKENNFASNDITTMVKFIELCNFKNKLTNWTIALKTTGFAKGDDGISKKILEPSESNLMQEVELSIRKGPSKNQDFYRNKFLFENKFYMTGRNANILSSSKDLSVSLNETIIIEAEKKYREEKAIEIQEKKLPQSQKEFIEKRLVKMKQYLLFTYLTLIIHLIMLLEMMPMTKMMVLKNT